MDKRGWVFLLVVLLVAAVSCGQKENKPLPSQSLSPAEEGILQQGLDIDELLEKYGEAFQPPEPLKIEDPKYPESAAKAGIQGRVLLRALVNQQGKVVKAEVLREVKVESRRGPAITQNPELEKAAIDAALQWTFTPAKLKGQPIEMWVTIPFVFKLK